MTLLFISQNCLSSPMNYFLALAKRWNMSADSDTLAFEFYSFLTVGLHCCTRAFSSCGERALLSRCGAWASHCGAQALELRGFSRRSKRAQ